MLICSIVFLTQAEWGMSWCASLSPAFWEGYKVTVKLYLKTRDSHIYVIIYTCVHMFDCIFFTQAEWGMSWCASLSPAFWEGYRELIPEDEGFRDRAPLYELYHKLNHYNLFGGGYASDALGLMEKLARIGDKRKKGGGGKLGV